MGSSTSSRSLVLMLSNIRLTNDPVVVLAPHMAIQPTVGLVFVAVYQFIYLCLDPIAGVRPVNLSPHHRH